MACSSPSFHDVADRLRPFLTRRVTPADVDDVLQDVFVRMQKGLPALRDDDRLDAWLFQVARSAIAEHGRARARHPLSTGDESLERAGHAAEDVDDDDDRAALRSLAGCVGMFVARLESPYREAIGMVELDGLTAREAAERAGISVSGMKSRVQRGRAQLRASFERCCEIAIDARSRVTEFRPRPRGCG